jgi:hypothetical protein
MDKIMKHKESKDMGIEDAKNLERDEDQRELDRLNQKTREEKKRDNESFRLLTGADGSEYVD